MWQNVEPQTSSLSNFFLFKNVSVHCANLIHVDNFSGLEKSKIIQDIEWDWWKKRVAAISASKKQASQLHHVHPKTMHGVVYCGKTIFKLIENYSVVMFFLWLARYIYHILSTSHKFHLCGERHVHRTPTSMCIRAVLEKPESIALTNYFLLWFFIFILSFSSQYGWSSVLYFVIRILARDCWSKHDYFLSLRSSLHGSRLDSIEQVLIYNILIAH